MPDRPRALTRTDASYPRVLDDLSDPPDVLFVRGRLPEPTRTVAIVGSRAATPYGRAQARTLARDLVAHGVAIVSGLAHGIDAAAHTAALEAGGATVAVLPGGLDAVTPRDHAALAEAIAARGALVSERPEGTAITRARFVQRNRLIAALSCATVVVEAAERSGALVTAAGARRIGRPVLAVPGDVDRPTSVGCHALIRGGARLCARAADVLDALPAVDGVALDARVSAALERVPLAVERVALRAEAPVDETLGALLRLEWAGVAVPCPGQRWARRGGE